MAGERPQNRTQPRLLLGREHEAFQVAEPDRRRGMVAKDSKRRVNQLIQRNP